MGLEGLLRVDHRRTRRTRLRDNHDGLSFHLRRCHDDDRLRDNEGAKRRTKTRTRTEQEQNKKRTRRTRRTRTRPEQMETKFICTLLPRIKWVQVPVKASENESV